VVIQGSRLPHVCSFGNHSGFFPHNHSGLFPQCAVSGAAFDMSSQGHFDDLPVLPSLTDRMPSGSTNVAKFDLKRGQISAVSPSHHPKLGTKIPPRKLTRPLSKSPAACGTCNGSEKKYPKPAFHNAGMFHVAACRNGVRIMSGDA
jgi:hypothetical protein